jgi:hypothetical protein
MVARLLLSMIAILQGGEDRPKSIDLTKLPRVISKEPQHITKQPRYCLLVFGLDAATRIWIVADGMCLYVDRDGDGDLTGLGAMPFTLRASLAAIAVSGDSCSS